MVLLSVGTIVTKMALRMGPPYSHMLKHLYSSVARAALRAGAVVLASTTVGNPEDFGVDEAALGAIARDRVIAMSFVPGESEWKSAATRLAERVKGGDGLDTAAALVAG